MLTKEEGELAVRLARKAIEECSYIHHKMLKRMLSRGFARDMML